MLHLRHCRWHSRKVFVSKLLKYYMVGLEQVANGVWAVYFGPVRRPFAQPGSVPKIRGSRATRGSSTTANEDLFLKPLLPPWSSGQ